MTLSFRWTVCFKSREYSINTNAVPIPATPHVNRPKLQPIVEFRNIITGPATANPAYPPNVCRLNALPIRVFETDADKIA